MSDKKTKTLLQGKLSPGLVKILAKNNLHTVEAVKRAYPERLLRMPGIGIVRFRMIEAELIHSGPYRPLFAASPFPEVPGSTLKNSPLPLATVRRLARNGVFTEQQLREAYPEKLMKISFIGLVSLREIERIFFPGQRYDPPKRKQPPPNFPRWS
ncbi:helix-hairpin-helix domain-containing protein [Comamonas piscis]|uniref:Helix-hairpin-helix domain-containing protein n=1 Tax=Comamonas piscis TaxID=1562974 RepID=A0A7G5EGU1_9BURK|nr:helix-hairpin-helix domain-containing protein [Comamonas piscis]QMV73216.1 helix-hairpin-helix domain-containing protein [Comamonas piscis]WSO36008.1 helix-hairpin-helix domain-containing protein [Comamonas piscis]